jgi:hypothetical protein
VLLATLGPLGAARVTLRVTDIAGGCCVEMEEVAAPGVGAPMPRNAFRSSG